MRDQLLYYYERELRFIRRMAAEFAHRYPAVAGKLLLEPDKCEDPHVERLIEAFAMMTARVQLKLDDDFSQVTEALLENLYPHYLAPLPSATIVQFHLDPDRGEGTTGVEVRRGSLLHANPMQGFRCRFRTCYPVTLWPIVVEGLDIVSLDRGEPGCPAAATAAIRIRLQTLGSQTFSELDIAKLRFFLDGDASVAHQLYELLFRNPLGVLVRSRPEGAAAGPSANPVFLEPDNLRPAGFGGEEGMLDYPRASQRGLRYLQEYFWFPDKYLFADLVGLDLGAFAVPTSRLEVLILLDELPLDLEARLGPENMKLGCTPAINLFPHQGEPIRFSHAVSEYQVVPDSHSPTYFETIAVDSVETIEPGTGKTRKFRPFFALRHGDSAGEDGPFWHTSRRQSLRKDDEGSELYLTLVDREDRPLQELPSETVIVHALCSNRDLPSRLPFGDERGDFQIEGQPGVTKIVTLRKPIAPLRPPEKQQRLWRLVSLLHLNHLSLVGRQEVAEDVFPDSPPVGGGFQHPEGELEIPAAFREILALLDFRGSAVTRQRIAGLGGLRSRQVLRRVTVSGSRVFARGLEVTLDFDESKYAGSGVFLFASILERFLGLYTSINSFTQTVATVKQREGVMKRWPPRAGTMSLV